MVVLAESGEEGGAVGALNDAITNGGFVVDVAGELAKAKDVGPKATVENDAPFFVVVSAEIDVEPKALLFHLFGIRPLAVVIPDRRAPFSVEGVRARVGRDPINECGVDGDGFIPLLEMN